MEHFVLQCPGWEEERQQILNLDMLSRTKFPLSRALAGYKRDESTTGKAKWHPLIEDVKAAVKFALATGRFNFFFKKKKKKARRAIVRFRSVQFCRGFNHLVR